MSVFKRCNRRLRCCNEQARATLAVFCIVACCAQPAAGQSAIGTAEQLAEATALLLPIAEKKLAACRQPASLTANARAAIAENRSNVTAIRTLAKRFRDGDERALDQLTIAVNSLNRNNSRLADMMSLCD